MSQYDEEGPKWYEDDDAPPESWDDPLIGEGAPSGGSGVPRALGAGPLNDDAVPAPRAGEDALTLARERVRSLVPAAVDVLEDLMETGAQRVRLGAAKEVLDRGGLPARQETHVNIDVTMDEQIERLLRSLSERNAGVGIEDAEVVEVEDAGVGTEYGVRGDGRWGSLEGSGGVDSRGPADMKEDSGALIVEGSGVAGVGSRGTEDQGPPEEGALREGVDAGVLPGRATAGVEEQGGGEGVPLSVVGKGVGEYVRTPSEGESERERGERLLREGATWQAHPHKE